MKKIELFVQGEGIKETMIVELSPTGRVRDVLEALQIEGEQVILFLENDEHHLDMEKPLEEDGIYHRKHIHLHRCHKIQVTVEL